MSKLTILVAEDDENIRMGLEDTLESEGYEVTSVADGNQAVEAVSRNNYSLILLDIMMPEKSGYEVCKIIRKKDDQTPIIMLTAKGEEIDKVVGLQLGADDYITKPFGVHELLARIAAVLRRSGKVANQVETQNTFMIGTVIVHSHKLSLEKNGKTVQLSQREAALLKLFYQHPDEVLTRDKILNDIWGVDYYGTTRTLDQHIAMLRKKTENDPSNPELIITVHGMGYKYSTENCRS
jgi:DNA-binding response OmpR family regulator